LRRPPRLAGGPGQLTIERLRALLPPAITGAVDAEALHSLAARDLVRGHGTDMPSGEAVARRMGALPFSVDEVGLRDRGWRAETPLWFYILRESAVRQAGNRLGDVGGRIVVEVLLGTIAADPESYVRLAPDWTPTLRGREGTFSLTDILAPDR
jgi:hypothetical protein